MRRQYRFLEYIGFQWIIQLYHDGKPVESYKVYVDEIEDTEETLLADGYTLGYTKREVEGAKKRYEEMLENIIQ